MKDKQKGIVTEDFLLSNDVAKTLYHRYAESMPILDYHCHISPKDLAENRKYQNLSEIWLEGDHYKWRAIRLCGYTERQITGNASPREKFQLFAQVVPKLLGNPLYHWVHLELKRYLDYDGILCPDTEEEVWRLGLERLPHLPVWEIGRRSKVQLLCTTDDPADDLHYHEQMRKNTAMPFRVLPAWRPDGVLNLNTPDFPSYLRRLERSCGRTIDTYTKLQECLIQRLDYFERMGCRVCDHGLDIPVYALATQAQVSELFALRLQGKLLNVRELAQYQTAILLFLFAEYNRRGWVAQIHFGAARNVNAGMFARLGGDSGFDVISGRNSIPAVLALLNRAASSGHLPRCVLYSLNPADNLPLSVLCGAFPGADTPNHVQHGAAWWFNDHEEGIRRHIRDYASVGVMGNYLGMLTDSRSMLSYSRHEYFRRILCDEIGRQVESGRYPRQIDVLGSMVEHICFHNANEFFQFNRTVEEGW